MKLKEYRLAANISQVNIAAQLGVSYESYQRWESGLIPAPKSKLEQLARIFKVSVEEILEEDLPPGGSRNDDMVREGLKNYGKVAIHFSGGGTPLLLSISKIGFDRLNQNLEGEDEEFFIVESQSNQSVIVRSKAVSDIHFYSEIHGISSLDASEYENRADYENVNFNDWAIIASIAQGDADIDDFEPADVERVRRTISVSDHANKSLIGSGDIKNKDRESINKENHDRTKRILELATEISYQTSNGARRNALCLIAADVFNSFSSYVEADQEAPKDARIKIEIEDQGQSIFISRGAFDYISIPTHLYECGRVDLLHLEDPD